MEEDVADAGPGPDRTRRGVLLGGAGLAGAGIAAAAMAAIGRGGDDDGGSTTLPRPGATAPAGSPPGGWRDATRDHGAQGTGAGDDRGALQDALDAAAAEGTGLLRGGTVHLGPGVFPISGSLFLRTGVTLRGSGPGTVIKLLPGADEPALVIETNPDGTPVANAAIRDLTLDGSTDAHTPGRHGIALRGNNRGGQTPLTGSDSFHLIADVIVAYFGGHGIAIGIDPPGGGTPAEVRAARILHAVVFDCAKAATGGDRAGILVGGTDGTLVACDVASSGGPGYLITRGNNRLEGCKGYFNEGEFVIQGGRNQLTGCQAQDSFGDGFVVRGAESSSLVGCQADSNTGVGFRLDGARSVVASGLAAFRRGDRRADGPGVVLENGTARCYLSGVVTGFPVAVEGENPDGITQIVT
ncbi:MAG TPA: right-handed parallel beta-helix repeat-containing protein [Iamia sp.]|nr:right-handed parallel beta-helix repeat-containing protein [Iamia sp.]